LLDKISSKASYLVSCDQVTDYEDGKYGVPNSDATELYIVDSVLRCCSCNIGVTGKFCKHQSAIMGLFKSAFPNAPAVTAKARHANASIALGNDCPPIQFYHGLNPGADETVDRLETADNEGSALIMELRHKQVTAGHVEVESHSATASSIAMSTLLDEFHKLMSMNCAQFSDDNECQKRLQKFTARLKNATTASSFTSFLRGVSIGHRCYRTGAAIRVQPTALSRWRPGVRIFSFACLFNAILIICA